MKNFITKTIKEMKNQIKKVGALAFALLFVGISSYAQPSTSQTYSTAGTFTFVVNTGYTATVKIEAWGGGGGGSYYGGGGGGAYAGTTTNIILSAGTYTVTVGSPGESRSYSSAGIAGGNSFFVISSGSTLTANGGGGGLGIFGDVGGGPGAGGAASSGSNITSYRGGNGSGGGGAGGGSATATGPGGDASDNTPGTGQGNGGAPFANRPAPDPGGGSGSYSIGNGGTGQVIVTVLASALPVSLLYFKAKAIQNTEGNAVGLAWATASELNAQNFKIERSRDLKTFELVATVKAAGNSKEQQEYSLTDQKPSFGTSYYRLTQIDFDGTPHFYTPVAVVIEDKTLPFGVFPNPVNNKVFNLKVESADEAQITLHNLLGNTVATQTSKISETVVEVKPQSELVAGTYIVTVQGLAGKKGYKLVVGQ